MADPQHTPDLDRFDRLTVGAYRLGLALAAAGLAWLAAALGTGGSAVGPWWLAWLGTVLAVGNLHLYDKRVRWIIQWCAWGGLLVRAAAGWLDADAIPVAAGLAHGLVMAALSGLILKEWFCFRIPGVRAVPLVLAVGVVARFGGADAVAAGSFALGALGVAAIAVAKARMPLGHDIGDRGHYQI